MSENTNNIPAKSGTTNDMSALDVRSEEVQEIIGRPPHWLVRWGITAFFGVLTLVLLSAFMIKYPETIETQITLTAIQAPQSLEPRINGKLNRLLVNNNALVQHGEVLAWVQSTANHEEVLELSARLERVREWLQAGELQAVSSIDLSGFNNLGELQTTFQGFEQSWREFLSFLPSGFYFRQRDILTREMAFTRQLLDNLQEEKQIRQAEYELAKREFEVQKQLAAEDFIAPMELARAERELAVQRLPLQQTESAIINNYVSQSAKQKELMELDRRIAEQRSVFLQAVNMLKSAVDDWKQNYLIMAPYDGQVVYAGILQENQTVNPGQELFYIQPEQSRFFGELTIRQESFGKIEVGQQVLVRFSGYPYHEFGTVRGEIDYFSEFPVRDSLFFAKVEFPDGLMTNYGYDIPPRNGMQGQAEIITQDMRLLERVYNNMTKELR